MCCACGWPRRIIATTSSSARSASTKSAKPTASSATPCATNFPTSTISTRPAHAVATTSLTGLDRWVLDEFSRLEQEVIEAYDGFEFHVVYQKLSQFVAVELSAIYHDAIKDRLYTDAAEFSRAGVRRKRRCTGWWRACARCWRRSCASRRMRPGSLCLDGWWIRRTGLRWVPMILPGPMRSERCGRGCSSCASWRCRSLEKARQAKTIGKALEARLTVTGSSSELAVAQTHAESLRELLNVSQLEFQAAGEASLAVSVSQAAGKKCERCWHWEPEVGMNAAHATLCGRCVKVVAERAASGGRG